jgi:hypothetical protein
MATLTRLLGMKLSPHFFVATQQRRTDGHNACNHKRTSTAYPAIVTMRLKRGAVPGPSESSKAMSQFGTKRTSQSRERMFAFEETADIAYT